jgi:type IV secretory pathway VirD2 relaxase
LNDWQSAGDERMFKLIISPEFGERLDLEALTRALMAEMERDLGTKLEWIAVSHFNTAHPHVHVALRGVNGRGEPLRLERDYVRHGIRQHAEDLCTAQLGYRTQADAQEAQRREIDQQRYTSLDRLIKRMGAAIKDEPDDPSFFKITADVNDPKLRGFAKAQKHYVVARLLVLQHMGLAENGGSNIWRVQRDFEDVLRAMQRASDRQRTLAAHGALLSDERLPFQVTSLAAFNELEGRVLGHGQEDSTSRTYVLIEGTDAKVHFIYQEDGIDAARHQGLMLVNSFVRLRKSFCRGRARLMVEDLGEAEKLLDNKPYLRSWAQYLIRRGVLVDELSGWGGWLGRYQAALHAEVKRLEMEGAVHHLGRPRGDAHGRP